MPDNIFIPQPQDYITPAMNLYKLMQQKKESELEQQKLGSLQDYHNQLRIQGKIQNIISLAKDQPEAAAVMFNNDPEMIQRNGGNQIEFTKTEGDWQIFEPEGGGTVYKINKKTGDMKKTEVVSAGENTTKEYTIKNRKTGEVKPVQIKYGESMPEGWDIVYAPSVTIVPTSEGYTAIRAERGSGPTTVTAQPTGKGKALPGTELKSGRELSVLKTLTNEISGLYKPYYVGPIQGRLGAVGEKYTGDLPESQAQFYQKLAHIKNTILYLRSGAQINEAEAKRLLEELPTRNLPNTTFEARLKGFNDYLNTIVQSREKSLQEGGYGVPSDENVGKFKGTPNIQEMTDEELLQELNK